MQSSAPFFSPLHRQIPPSTPKARLAARLGFVWALLVAVFYQFGFFDRAEDKLLDWEQTFLAARLPDAGFALVSIEHVPSDRPWPWSRLEYALLLRGLVPDHPQSVVFEMAMSDADPRFAAFDESFDDLIARIDQVVFSAPALGPQGKEPLPPDLPFLSGPAKGGDLAAFGSALWPIATFAAGRPVGLPNFSADPDQILRRVPLVSRMRGKIVPSLALTAAAVRLGADLRKSVLTGDSEIVLRAADGRELRRIPVDNEGRFRLRFRKPGFVPLRIDYDNFLLYADQTQRGVETPVDLRRLAGRQVWIGAVDPAVVDPFTTVLGPLSPVEIQLQAAAQIVRGEFVGAIPRPLVALLFLATGILLAYAAHHLPFGRAIVVVAGTTLLVYVLAIAAFVAADVAFPLVSLGVLSIGVILCSRAAGAWEMEPGTEN